MKQVLGKWKVFPTFFQPGVMQSSTSSTRCICIFHPASDGTFFSSILDSSWSNNLSGNPWARAKCPYGTYCLIIYHPLRILAIANGQWQLVYLNIFVPLRKLLDSLPELSFWGYWGIFAKNVGKLRCSNLPKVWPLVKHGNVGGMASLEWSQLIWHQWENKTAISPLVNVNQKLRQISMFQG